MSAIGPDLPPHLLAKRKRQQESEVAVEDATASGANNEESNGKRRRVVGPALPPAPIAEPDEEKENTAHGEIDEEDDDEEDDEFGPALPSEHITESLRPQQRPENDASVPTLPPDADSSKPQRDAWMTMPPKQDDLAARMDPTKQRARGFNTGKGTNAGASDGSAWNETPEQKQKRLRDEMMGVAKPSDRLTNAAKTSETGPRAASADVRSKDQAAAPARGPSLLDRHQHAKKGQDLDDDPSKCAFDRDKDMASGLRISGTQRKQMLEKAAGFSAKFSGGGYL